MKHLYCKKCNSVLPKWETICDKCGYFNGGIYSVPPRRTTFKDVIIALGISIIVIIIIFLASFSSLFIEAYKDKRVAIEYVDTNYPDAKFIKGIYKTQEIRIAAPKPDNRFIFENDGVRFQVSVGEGKIVADGYWSSYAEHQLYNAYIKPFVEPRNITAEFEYIEFDLADFFENNPNADISQFDGDISFRILLFNDERSENPESLGWLYDFYCHCKENITIPRYSVTIFCKKNNTLKFTHETEFKNEADFYNSFD